MARGRKSDKSGGTSTKAQAFSMLDEEDHTSEDSEEELPKDEAGRRKIKRQYEDLLGIRIQKLRGRILNRERINKTIEGIYFICADCVKVCHHVDDALTEDPESLRNLCGACSTKPTDTKTAKETKASKGKQAAA